MGGTFDHYTNLENFVTTYKNDNFIIIFSLTIDVFIIIINIK